MNPDPELTDIPEGLWEGIRIQAFLVPFPDLKRMHVQGIVGRFKQERWSERGPWKQGGFQDLISAVARFFQLSQQKNQVNL